VPQETDAEKIARPKCRQCGRPLQGGHPRQTSDASGAAASQLGPRAVALATQLNKGLGLPYGKTSAVLKQAFGLAVTPGGVGQAIARAARKVWGGNRAPRGAHTQEILVSLLATCRQQHHSARTVLSGLPCSPEPQQLDRTAAHLPPPRLPLIRHDF